LDLQRRGTSTEVYDQSREKNTQQQQLMDFNRTQAATWKYVPSAENLANILSRGASFKELQASKLSNVGPE
jgi:hypothetical protein